jgi:hypothetical protein
MAVITGGQYGYFAGSTVSRGTSPTSAMTRPTANPSTARTARTPCSTTASGWCPTGRAGWSPAARSIATGILHARAGRPTRGDGQGGPGAAPMTLRRWIHGPCCTATPPPGLLGPAIALDRGGVLLRVYEELARHHGQMEIPRDVLRAELGTCRPGPWTVSVTGSHHLPGVVRSVGSATGSPPGVAARSGGKVKLSEGAESVPEPGWTCPRSPVSTPPPARTTCTRSWLA